MAVARERAKTWFTNLDNLDMRSVDVATLTSGKVVVAFGGSLMTSGVLYAAELNLGSDTLGALSEKLYAPGLGGFGVTTLGEIDLTAGPKGKLIASLHLPNSGIGPDGNMGLLQQPMAGGAPKGAARPVNPESLQDATLPDSATVILKSGKSLVFFSEVGTKGVTDLSNGIRMATFDASGKSVGAARTVVEDRTIPIFGSFTIEANPEYPAAAAMQNGNVGLVYKESNSTGTPTVFFQELTQAGRSVGAAVQLDSAATLPELTVLKSGAMVATWLKGDGLGRGVYKAQMLSVDGDPVGDIFDVSAGFGNYEIGLDVTATRNGGFAVAWYDRGIGQFYGRMFDGTGAALGNDFALLDTAQDFGTDVFSGGLFGVTAVGGDVLAWVSGLKSEIGSVGGVTGIDGQQWKTVATLGRVLDGNGGKNVLSGSAKDDTLDGRGGNDRLTGQGGNDILLGGSGRDTISAGAGDDVIRAGAGRDKVTGGAGSDMFLFDLPQDGGDRITDFNAAEGDNIGIDFSAFGGTFQPVVPTVTVGETLNTSVAGLFLETATGKLTIDLDGFGPQARTLVAVLDGVETLSFSDVFFY